MPLPELIEIIPLTKPVRAEITVPGSKSITNRALILAALADGETTLQGALWSEDTQIMVECLQKLGFEVRLEPDPNEFCNRIITVKGLGGRIPNAGTAYQPLELFVGNAGTAARFLAAFVCLGNGVYRLHGVPRMHERPQAALFQALRELGYRVESEQGNDKLPARIAGESSFSGSSRGDETHTKENSQSLLTSTATSKKARSCTVSIEKSSQFASALLLCAKIGNWQVKVVGENAEESPYVAMTKQLVDAFPNRGGSFQVEADASSGSYFFASQWLLLLNAMTEKSKIIVERWPTSNWQMDGKFPTLLYPAWNREESIKSPTIFGLMTQFSRRNDLADSIMTLIVLAPLATPVMTGNRSVSFLDLGRLRVQETDRVIALREQLTKCGAKVIEEGDALTVYPSTLHGAEIETYDDHRMAMCFAILGLKVPGIKIKNPSCVKKTFPNFFQKLADDPPKGLGVEIWEIQNGKRTRRLSGDELFAE